MILCALNSTDKGHCLLGARARRSPRPGFTLVELLVAMALTLFIMVILSEAFSAGLGTFRQLKAVADMQEKLRTAAIILRRDLQANWYDGSNRLDNVDFNTTSPQTGPPQSGFFRVWQGSTSITEGTDGDGIPSIRMQAPDNLLHFSIDLSHLHLAARPEDFLSVTGLPASLSVGPADMQGSNSFNSQMGEVAYFLGPNSTGSTGTTKNGTFGGIPLFALYRRQLLAANSQSEASTYLNVAQATPPPRVSYSASSAPLQDNVYFEVSAKQDPTASSFLYFNSLTDLTIPDRRFGMGPHTASITGASNASPIQITSSGHNLTTGAGVFISGVGGNTAANGAWNITVVDANNFTLNGSTGNAAYTAGGTLTTGGGGVPTVASTYPTLSTQLGSTSANAGDDILLTNVVSFSVRLLMVGTITAATNVTPIQITSPGHNLATGTTVWISGVGGNTAANGSFTISVVDANNFTLNGSTGNGTYTPGTGIWRANPDFIDVASAGTNQNLALGMSGANVSVFDTWSRAAVSSTSPYDYSNLNWSTPGTYTSLPLRVKVVAIQIILRVWDEKTERTRQVTIVQDM
jgi:prepilin-type N-terminal cleavage/methylation domain-containing protein